MRRLRLFLPLPFLAVLTLGCDLGSDGAAPGTMPKRQVRLHGGGSSFVAPIMKRWCADYQKAKDVKVHYQSVGSGSGIQHVTLSNFDFGASDSPMTPDQVRRAQDNGGEVVHIPLCMGAVVLAYNLPVEQPIRFTPAVIADIFLGKIKNWNDDALKEINPGVNLPDRPIVVIHRADNSGTTFVFTEYLSRVSPEWEKEVGFGQSVKWRVGEAQRGNEGVAAAIKRTPGALGYTELTYALESRLKMGHVQNREKAFVRPDLGSVTAAAASKLTDIPDDLRYSLTDVAGKESYPISGTVWAIIYLNQKGDKGKALVDFLRWVTHEGQQSCEELHYARLPEGLVKKLDKKLDQVQISP